MIYRAIIYVLFIKPNTHGGEWVLARGNTLWMAISCVRQEAPVVVVVVAALGPGSVVVLALPCSD